MAADLDRIEEGGQMLHARPGNVSAQAKRRQRDEMGTLGSGNHYLEVQEVAEDLRLETAAFGLHAGDIVVMIHCGSRGLGHQIGTEFLREMAVSAAAYGIVLPGPRARLRADQLELGQDYLGAMRAAINCALANRQILTHLVREVFAGIAAEGAACRCCTTSRTTRARSKRIQVTAGRRCTSTARARHAPSAPAIQNCLKRCARWVSRC